MSTRMSFGYGDPGKGEPDYHLYEDYADPGVVFLRLPRECLDELAGDELTLRMTPEMWEAIRQHACPNCVPKDWKPPTVEDLQAFGEWFRGIRKPAGDPPQPQEDAKHGCE